MLFDYYVVAQRITSDQVVFIDKGWLTGLLYSHSEKLALKDQAMTQLRADRSIKELRADYVFDVKAGRTVRFSRVVR